jgi:hypothetical protein
MLVISNSRITTLSNPQFSTPTLELESGTRTIADLRHGIHSLGILVCDASMYNLFSQSGLGPCVRDLAKQAKMSHGDD